MRSIKALYAIAFAILAVPMFGAGFIKFDGIDGDVKAAGHEKWIELGSVQFQGESCNYAPRAGATRHASVELLDIPAALVQACTSQRRFASVVMDIGGRRHTLQNVSLAQCPAPATAKMKGARVVVRLDFAACSDHAPRAGHVKVFDGASAQLIGLTPTPIDVGIVKTTLRGKSATASFVPGTDLQIFGWPAGPAAGKVSKVDALTIKQKVTSTSTTFKNVVITSYASGPEGPTLTFEFETMTGSPADYLKLADR